MRSLDFLVVQETKIKSWSTVGEDDAKLLNLWCEYGTELNCLCQSTCPVLQSIDETYWVAPLVDALVVNNLFSQITGELCPTPGSLISHV